MAGIDWDRKLAQSCTDIRPVRKPLNWREYPFSLVYGQVDTELFSMTDWRDCARQTLGMRNFGRMAGDFGGTSFWMKGPDWLDSRALADRAAEMGVLIELGEVFFQPGAAQHN